MSPDPFDTQALPGRCPECRQRVFLQAPGLTHHRGSWGNIFEDHSWWVWCDQDGEVHRCAG